MRKIYRSLVDHLTKVLGTLGAGFMSVVVFIDPAVVREAAQTYLGDKWVAKIGIALFILVLVRGWYTGRKAQQRDALPPPDPSTVAKIVLLLCAIAIGFIAPRAYAVEVPASDGDVTDLDDAGVSWVTDEWVGVVVGFEKREPV